MPTITQDLIRRGASGTGGWTRKQLELLGVQYPPRSGWRQFICGRFISEKDQAEFLALKDSSRARQKAIAAGEKQSDLFSGPAAAPKRPLVVRGKTTPCDPGIKICPAPCGIPPWEECPNCNFEKILEGILSCC